jgi:hypothetical protein
VTASPFAIPVDAADLVIAYVAGGQAIEVVPAVLDGRTVLLGLELDMAEHSRRLESSAAAPSRGLLHALWALPAGHPCPASSLDRLDADTLEIEGRGFVTNSGGSITRTYRPAGHVRAIGVVSRRLADAVAAAGQFPPIFRRYAISMRAASADNHAVTAARAVGVGAAVTASGRLRELVGVETPRVGVPAVYRWWLAEVAYRSWRQANAH